MSMMETPVNKLVSVIVLIMVFAQVNYFLFNDQYYSTAQTYGMALMVFTELLLVCWIWENDYFV